MDVPFRILSTATLRRALSVVVFPDPIDSRRLASVLSSEALAQALGVNNNPIREVNRVGGSSRTISVKRSSLVVTVRASRRRAVCPDLPEPPQNRLVHAGRARWKVENENNNTLQTKGYNLTHNFGHFTLGAP